VDNDPLTVLIVQGPVNGELTLQKNGAFDYSPNSGYTGSDSFTYKANDGTANSSQATVLITINPVNSTDTVTIISASYNPKPKKLDVKATSSHQPNAILTVVGYGQMSFDATENVYTYNSRGPEPEGGIVSVTSNLGGSDSYNINGGSTNQAPVAENQSVFVSVNNPATITLTASDPENDPLTYVIITEPTEGELTGTPPEVIYAPNAGYEGVDSFTFRANDGNSDSNVATVTINVGNQTTDQVTVLLAQYKVKAKQLLVEATSSMQPEPLLTLEGYGEMTFSAADGKYIYQSKVSADPGDSVTVKSNHGGSDTAPIQLK
jgi:hypothetical protein